MAQRKQPAEQTSTEAELSICGIQQQNTSEKDDWNLYMRHRLRTWHNFAGKYRFSFGAGFGKFIFLAAREFSRATMKTLTTRHSPLGFAAFVIVFVAGNRLSMLSLPDKEDC